MFLTKEHHAALHVARDLSLVALSITLLPLSIFIVLLARILVAVSLIKEPKSMQQIHNGRQIRVLVTGVGMAKGLFLARTLYLGGCLVIGADFENHKIPVCGRFSRAVDKFYKLYSPARKRGAGAYIDQVLELVKREKIDLWISCSGVATALEDARLMQRIESQTSCKCFQFNEEATFKLDNKYEFMGTTTGLGLQVPHWGSITCPEDALMVFERPSNKLVGTESPEFMLKNVAMDDSTRGALPLVSADRPKQAVEVLQSLDYTDASWIMQQHIPGNEEYCTHSIVVNGHVRAFLACPSASVLMHYELLEETSPLFQAMLRFTQTYATGMYAKYGNFSGHLSFDFLTLNESRVDGVKKTLLPIECNPRCHTAVVHFRGSESSLTSAYLSLLLLGKESNPPRYVPDLITGHVRAESSGFYWIAHDLVVLYALPVIQLISGDRSLGHTLESHLEFWKHVALWKDPTLEWWDPMPWLVLNHVYWPGQLLMASWFGKRWSQINVSTGKMFIV